MTCPHGISTARVTFWEENEAKRAAKEPRPYTSVCSCCGGPFQSLPGFESERCSHCLAGDAQQYELSA